MSSDISEIRRKIDALVSSSHENTHESGTRIDLGSQTKGELPLSRVDTAPLVDILRSVLDVLERIEAKRAA